MTGPGHGRGRWVGRGDKEGGDGAAVDAMRERSTRFPCAGWWSSAKAKGHAPMLYNGEEVGNGDADQVRLAVDPIDGTADEQELTNAIGTGGSRSAP